jgi:hypothetical protein
VKPKIDSFPNGLKVHELKRILKDWPEFDRNGDPYEVWVSDPTGLSNEVREVSPLNVERPGCDLLLCTRRERHGEA